MDIERDYFYKKQAVFERLRRYGFADAGEGLSYSEVFLDSAFRAELTVSRSGHVSGRVIDLDTGEEYAAIRNERYTGAFVGSVREAYADLLGRVADACFIERPFDSDQANRIAAQILERWGETPDCPFSDDAGLVFRCPNNRRWYAIVMNVERRKLQGETGKDFVDVMNVKIEEEKLEQLLAEPGVHVCYHMNKKKWVSIVLDGTVTDGRIMELLATSRALVAGISPASGGDRPQAWVIPANPKYYDIHEHLKHSDEQLWHQDFKARVGDIVYIYYGAPYSAILWQTKVIAADIPHDYSEKGRKTRLQMLLKLTHSYAADEFPRTRLIALGLKSVRGARSVPQALQQVLKETAGHR